MVITIPTHIYDCSNTTIQNENFLAYTYFYSPDSPDSPNYNVDMIKVSLHKDGHYENDDPTECQYNRNGVKLSATLGDALLLQIPGL